MLMYRIQFLVSDQKYLLPDIRWDIRLKPEIETVSVIYILLHFIPVLCVTHTHTHPFNGPFSGTPRVSRYQKGKTNLDFTEARDGE